MAKDKSAAADDAVPADAAPAPAAEHHLTVIHPFGRYQRGDVITDPALIDAIKAGENAHHCHKIKPQ